MQRTITIEVSTHNIDGLLLPAAKTVKRVVYYRDRESLRLAALSESSVREETEVTTGSPDGHRGIWFYDPTLYGDIVVGDVVVFKSSGMFLAQGVVTGVVKFEDYPKYCSAINSKGFSWEPVYTGAL